MSIDFTVAELELLSSILADFSTRQEKFCFLYSTQIDLLGNLINKVDNQLSL